MIALKGRSFQKMGYLRKSNCLYCRFTLKANKKGDAGKGVIFTVLSHQNAVEETVPLQSYIQKEDLNTCTSDIRCWTLTTPVIRYVHQPLSGQIEGVIDFAACTGME